MRINNKKLKNRKKLLVDFVSNKESQPMRAKDIAMLVFFIENDPNFFRFWMNWRRKEKSSVKKESMKKSGRLLQ